MTPNLGQGGCTALEVPLLIKFRLRQPETVYGCAPAGCFSMCSVRAKLYCDIRPLPGVIPLSCASGLKQSQQTAHAKLQDGVVLARALQQLLRQSGGGGGGGGVTATAVEGALRRYEADRRKRVLPLTLRSHAFGRLLQLSFPPVSSLNASSAFDALGLRCTIAHLSAVVCALRIYD